MEFANLPTNYGDFKIAVIKQDNLEHCILTYGDIADNTLVRIHSECLTGDTFGSLKCDCGQQLDLSLKLIVDNKSGILIYLRQEGRGIGLANKIKCYNLKEQGYDTYDANIELGFEPDLRKYNIAAKILNELNISKINLLSNNPDKIKQLELLNIEVVQVPLISEPNMHNHDYFLAKKLKFNHLL